jgi:RNA polymerase sigma factor (sigma-70 family)
MPDAARRELADLSDVARRAADGREDAWRDLVKRLDGLLRAVAKGYRLAAADVDDVVQTAWLRAVDHIGRLKDPGAIASWLIVTVRREAMRSLQRGVREVLTDDPGVVLEADPVTPESIVIDQERDAAVHDAVSRLSQRQRRIVESMLSSPTSYQQLAARLEMPIGSIGPTRDRALSRLRDDAKLALVVD